MKFELTDEIKEYLIAKEEYKKAYEKVSDAKHKLTKHFKPLFYFDECYKDSFTVRASTYTAMDRLGYRKKIAEKSPYIETAWFKGEKSITRSEFYETEAFISSLEIYNDGRIEEGYRVFPLNKVPKEDKERIKEFLLNEYLKIVNKEQTQ